MSTNRYKYVLAVASGRLMRKAAKELFVSEATMSQQITKLEQELGIVLFDRAHYLCPTDECKALLPYFQAVIDAQNAIHESVCALKEPKIETAQFIPTSGNLRCPHCSSLIIASNGRVIQLRSQEQGKYWDEMSTQKWQCCKCHQRFALPANPFAEHEEKPA